MFIKFCYLLIFTLALASSVMADCNNAIPRTTPDQAFTLYDDGTVTHNNTGLMWMRCQLGQTWNGSTCSGTAQTYNWQNALQMAESVSFAGYNDWRLPNKNELISIVERACYNPAINTTAFPNTASSGIWSSSQPAFRANSSWGMNFRDGSVDSVYKPGNAHVRLVRGGQ